MSDCIFCNRIEDKDFMFIGSLIAILDDKFPVTKGHVLVIPIRHISFLWDMTEEENTALMVTIKNLKDFMIKEDPTITGFNIGWNCGTSAGQTVNHAHCHMIPRRNGDCGNPVGGVRGVIPCMQDYTK